jgi:hypothetical protein
MEFNYITTGVLRCDEEGFAILDGSKPPKNVASNANRTN